MEIPVKEGSRWRNRTSSRVFVCNSTDAALARSADETPDGDFVYATAADFSDSWAGPEADFHTNFLPI